MNNKKLDCRFSVSIDSENRGVRFIHNGMFIPLGNLFIKDKKRVSNDKAYKTIKKWAERKNFNIVAV